MRKTLGFAFSALLVISGCDVIAIGGGGGTVTGSGVSVEQKIKDVGAFTELDISATFEATVTVGSEPSVTLNVDDNLLRLVEVRVEDGRLVVRSVDGPIIVANKPQKVTIVVPKLEVIAARGASKVLVSGFEGKSIRIDSEGASAVELRGFSFESVALKVAGAGRITLMGRGKALTLDASGASKLAAAEAAFESAEVVLSGAARCEIHSSGSITGDLSGASSLIVQGEPATRVVKTSGVSTVTY